MEIPKYTEEEKATLKKGFQKLRMSNSNAKVPFFWIQSGADGHPRLFIGKTNAPKVPGSLTNPAKRSAKDKKNIAEGLAWKNDSQGVTFQVLRGTFKFNKAKLLIRLMEKSIKVKIGKIEIYAMEADEAAKLGQAYVKEQERENTENKNLAAQKHEQATVLKGAIGSSGTVEELLGALPPGTLSGEERSMVLAEGFDGLRRLIAAKEQEELDARSMLVVLSPKEHNKFISGAFAKAEASSMKWRARFSGIRDPEEDLGPWDPEEEWKFDLQVQEEFQNELDAPTLDCNVEDIRYEMLKKNYDNLRSEHDTVVASVLALQGDVSKEALNDWNHQLSSSHQRVSDVLNRMLATCNSLLYKSESRKEAASVQTEFYRQRSKFEEVPGLGWMWKSDKDKSEKLKTVFAASKVNETAADAYTSSAKELTTFVQEQSIERDQQFTTGKDHLLRLNLLPEQRESYDELLESRDENNAANKSQETALQLKKTNKKIRGKQIKRDKLKEEIRKLKSSFFMRKKTKEAIKAKEQELALIEEELDTATVEKSNAESDVNELLKEVVNKTDKKARIEQNIRDLELRKKKKKTGKDAIQEDIDALKEELEEVNDDLERARKENRTRMVEPQARLDAANAAYEEKDALKRKAVRDLGKLREKLAKTKFFGKDAMRAKIKELEAQIVSIDEELSVLMTEKQQWFKEVLDHQSVEEDIAELRVDAVAQRTNEAESRLNESLSEAGLAEKEVAYHELYNQTHELDEALTTSTQKKAQAQILVKNLEMGLGQAQNDVNRTEYERDEAVTRQKDATAALSRQDLFISTFNDSENQSALKENLIAGGDLDVMFPETEMEELQGLREALFSRLEGLGIQSGNELTKEQVSELIKAKGEYLNKERELLSKSANEAGEEADLANIKAKYAALESRLYKVKGNKDVSVTQLEATQKEITDLLAERVEIKARRDRLKPKAEKERERLVDLKMKAIAARKAAKDAQKEIDPEEGPAIVKTKIAAFNKAREKYNEAKSLFDISKNRIESYENSAQRASDIKGLVKLKKSVVKKITEQIGDKANGFILEINQVTAEMDDLQEQHPNILAKMKRDKESAVNDIQSKIDEALSQLETCEAEEQEARNAYVEQQSALKDIESEMMESVQQNPDSEKLQSQIQELHHTYQDQEDAEFERQVIEAHGLALQHSEEITSIYEESLSMSKEAIDALSLFKDVEDIYEATRSPEKAPSQLQRKATENPEEYALSMAYVDKIIADVKRLKALGQPENKYLQLLDPIPKAFWPDDLVAESQDFAEIEALFADEQQSDEDLRTGFLKKAMAHSEDFLDYGNNLNGFVLCSNDFSSLFTSAGDTATAAWPVAGTIGVVLSAANMVGEVSAVLNRRNEHTEEALNAEDLSEEEILEIRRKLENTNMDDVLSLGEGATDLLYKSAFAAECFMSVPSHPLIDSMPSVVPGLGIASTSILLAMKGKQAVEAYSKHSADVGLVDEIENDEDTANDLAFQGAMKNRAERSRQQKVVATSDAVGAAGALTAQVGVATGSAAAAVGWMIEAGAGAVSAGLKLYYKKDNAKKAKQTLERAKQGSRRAMMDIFQNSATYSTQLMLKRATEGNSAAIRFCESRGLSKGALVDGQMGKGILRKMLLEDAGQNQEVQGGVSLRDMWDSINSAQKILEQSDTGASANDPGPVWFQVQNRLVEGQLKSAKRLSEGSDYKIQITSLNRILEGYPKVKANWKTLKLEMEDEQRWKPSTFDDKKKERLKHIVVASFTIDKLITEIEGLIDSIESDVLPEQWRAVKMKAA